MRLVDSSYSMDQSAGTLSQNSSVIGKNNINNMDNSWRKLIQENLRFDNLQKILLS